MPFDPSKLGVPITGGFDTGFDPSLLGAPEKQLSVPPPSFFERMRERVQTGVKEFKEAPTFGEAFLSTTGAVGGVAGEALMAPIQPFLTGISGTFKKAEQYLPELTPEISARVRAILTPALQELAKGVDFYKKYKTENPQEAERFEKNLKNVLDTSLLLPGAEAVRLGIEKGPAVVRKAGEVAKVTLEKATALPARIAPKLLSYTSDVPEKAFDSLLARREPVTAAIRAGATPEQALGDIQVAVRGLRTSLTQEWKEAIPSIADEFEPLRIGFSEKLQKDLFTLRDEFAVELPQNLKSISAKEMIELAKNINEIKKGAIAVSPKGAIVRKTSDTVKNLAITTFGGEKGSVATLWKNYAVKKGVFDAANDLVRAYSTGKPIQQATALGRIKALFNDNKGAYLNAILDLEKATGRDLLSKVTAAQFKEVLPSKFSSVSASGGLQAPKGALDKAIALLLTPLTSPRSAAWITKNLGKLEELGAKNGIINP